MIDPGSAEDAAPKFSALTILLAEDDPDDCLLFKDALDESPIKTELVTVANGEQLMKLLATSNSLPDLLFMDLNMPRMNGFECLSEIRRNEQLNKLPIIIISTSSDKEKVAKLIHNGAQHYIRKSCDYNELKKFIHQALLLLA
ncbi:response regulator [Arundinibacter roseus]|uniref:Response regulator n=1 Tax=Arundinibacter roseus TaxID=2070510 RepID=A0A4R4KHZ8_9BACT|nr:response regulator [Arundinibacter roseus]TDB67463.1 response regulator [Arundinibacter roseus]